MTARFQGEWNDEKLLSLLSLDDELENELKLVLLIDDAPLVELTELPDGLLDWLELLCDELDCELELRLEELLTLLDERDEDEGYDDEEKLELEPELRDELDDPDDELKLEELLLEQLLPKFIVTLMWQGVPSKITNAQPLDVELELELGLELDPRLELELKLEREEELELELVPLLIACS